MISVIVPVYNVEKYLRKCIASIQRQTYTDLEIILVDDGSTDRSGIICDELATEDSRITVIHQANGGQASARNNGLELAKGEYIGFVDSDDYIHPRMFSVLHSLILEYEADISICGNYMVTERGTVIDKNEDGEAIVLKRDELWGEIFGHLNNAVWNKLFVANKLSEIRFPEGIIHGEDLLFNLEYLKKCNRGAQTKAPLYYYVKREGSITQQPFSPQKIFEIQSKDLAKSIITNEAPELVSIAEVFSFRARMNVLRSIIKANVQKQYSKVEQECIQYANIHYCKVKHLLRMKEKIEYNLLNTVRPLYTLITRKTKTI